MGKICILTDSSIQFTRLNFPGQGFIKKLPLEIYLHDGNNKPLGDNDINIREMPDSTGEHLHPRLISPPQEKIRSIVSGLGQEYEEVLGIFISSNLNPCLFDVQNAVQSLGLVERFQLIDSQTISVGLGYVVEQTAQLLYRGGSLADIERLAFSISSRIYSIFCCPGLTYLYHNGFLDFAQANIGEMLGLLSLFAIEEGKLVPLEKMRNHRQVIDYYQEFIEEFENIEFIGMIQSIPPTGSISRYIKDYIKNNFPQTPFSEFKLNAALATLFGPRTTGIALIEKTNHK